MIARVATAAALAAMVAGCGGGGSHPRRSVKLTIAAPGDRAVMRADSVQVSGRVSPGTASVRVRGERVKVQGGSFTARVPLEPGTNLVDVLASAGGARPAMVALRVQRQVTVQVPEIGGYSPSDAEDALAALGLHADVKKTGGFFEVLLPVDARVCDTEPAQGTTVDPGTTVRVLVSKTC